MKLPEPGDVLADKYALDEVLGEGGFGIVFKATTVTTGRPVAVKVLKPSPDHAAASHAARFLREMTTVAQLQCPHTMTLYDFGRADDDVLFMVCEYIEGEDLLDVLARRGRLWEHEVVHIARQVLLALAEAHDLGVLHRDVKPHNIRVHEYQGDSLRVKVLDFGLAKSWQDNDDASLTGAGRVIGTPRYMSPEHRAGLPLTPASDIYSLGLVIVEMLLGRDATKLDRRQKLQITDEMPVTRPLALIVNRMISTHATQRYTQASEVLSDLQSMRTPTDRVPTQPDLTADEDEDDTVPTPQKATAARVEATRLERGEHEKAPEEGESINGRTAVAVAVGAFVLFGAAIFLVSGFDAEPPVAENRRAAPLPTTVDSEPSTVPDIGAVAVDAGVPTPGVAADMAGGCEGYEQLEPGIHVIRSMQGLSTVEPAVAIPKGYDATKRHGLILTFGSDDHDGRRDLGPYAMETVSATEFPYVVLHLPSNLSLRGWSERKTRRALEVLPIVVERVCVDLDRAFAVGRSAGGYDANYLSTLANVRAVALTDFRGTRTYPLNSSPVPTITLSGSSDPSTPMAGGPNCAAFPVRPYDKYVSGLREDHRCNAKTQRSVPAPKLGSCQTWDCDVPLTMCLIDGSGTWQREENSERIRSCWAEPSGFPFRDTILTFFRSRDPAFAGEPIDRADAGLSGD